MSDNRIYFATKEYVDDEIGSVANFNSVIAKLTENTRVSSGDSIITNNSNGSHRVATAQAILDMLGMISPMMHRNIYGGRYLGSSVTAAQKTAIQNGTFDNLFVGDYWTINGIDWIIADMNYFYNCGDTAFTSNHLIVIPRVALYNYVMNDAHTTYGGYANSKMRTNGLAEAKTKFNAAFPNMVLSHRDLFVNAVTNGYPSGGLWDSSDVELMTEVMVYGTNFFNSVINGGNIPYIYTTAKTQFALFQLRPDLITTRGWYWLRDVVSSAYFANINHVGNADYNDAGTSSGVRPYAVIG